MSLFGSPEEHAANPPESWRTMKSGGRWALLAGDGGRLDTYRTKREAEEARRTGFYAELYADETRWYAGEAVRGWKPYQRPAAAARG